MENLTHQQRIANKLKELAPNLSQGDKRDFLKTGHMSSPTMYKYLNGEVSDIEAALGMYNWFKAKLDQREKAIAAVETN